MSDPQDCPTPGACSAAAEIERLRAALRECADDLAAEIEARYPAPIRRAFSSEQRRYDRDMEPVRSSA